MRKAILILFAAGALVASACTPQAAPTPTSTPQQVAKPAASQPTTKPGGNVATKQWSAPPAMQIDPNKTYIATMKTNQGDIKIELNAKDVPGTVNNFVFLARQGYYDGTPFHRVIKGFMIQGGDPTGTGTGGPGYRIQDEYPVKGDYERGVIAMARTQAPNSAGSQFFIMHANYGLPKQYVIFGKVIDGLEAVDKIANVPVGPSAGGEQSQPQQEVKILTITIEER